MPSMRAVQVREAGGDFELVEKEIPEPKSGEVLIKVEACGICAGDELAKDGGGPFPIKYPITPGHEVAGKVAKIGAGETVWKLGQRVGVGWHGGHCMQCMACRNGDIAACANSLITGLTINGGYAEYMLARAESLVAMPDEFGAAEAAPLLCAGVTVFGGLQRAAPKRAIWSPFTGSGDSATWRSSSRKSLDFEPWRSRAGAIKKRCRIRWGRTRMLIPKKERLRLNCRKWAAPMQLSARRLTARRLQLWWAGWRAADIW